MTKADMFISLVRKYTRAKKLTRMLNELVEKIEVFNAEKVNGVWEQRLAFTYILQFTFLFGYVHTIHIIRLNTSCCVLTVD